MWWPFGLALAVLLPSLATCTPVEPASSRIIKEVTAEEHHLTTGIGTRDSGGHPHIRREIRDLYANYPDHWALYLLGLLKFQQVEEYDPLSYYRIAGIHGRPYELWQNARGTPEAPVGAYCPHNNRLFLTWHRPYLALFEQELWKHVRSIADQAQVDHDRWSAAADAFRIPYWDTGLGAGDGGIPDFLISPKWSIFGPNGTQLIDNPLFWYQFHPLVPGDFPAQSMALYNQTMRWPTTRYSDAKPQMGLFQSKYLTDQRDRQNSVHAAFQWNSSFHDFSATLETAHSYIHANTGGEPNNLIQSFSGHMWDLEYSAFDPIFMLHHANFDRYMALYTTANPDAWIQPEVIDSTINMPNFWIQRNAIIDANYGLPPFWKDVNTFYSSEDVRHTDIFGYAYPETQYWNFASKEEWRNNVRGRIQKLYPNSARVTLTNAVALGTELTHVVAEGNRFTDWIIEAKASPTEMLTSFSAKFLLVSDFSSDNSTQVGTWTRMMTEDRETGVRKAHQPERKVKHYSAIDQSLSSTMSLTSSLLDQITAGKLENLDPEVVVPYLKAHLTWTVYTGREQNRLTPERLENFNVRVTSTKVRIPEDPSQPLEYSSDTTSYTIGMEE